MDGVGWHPSTFDFDMYGNFGSDCLAQPNHLHTVFLREKKTHTHTHTQRQQQTRYVRACGQNDLKV